jgi:hypothetical protein
MHAVRTDFGLIAVISKSYLELFIKRELEIKAL